MTDPSVALCMIVRNEEPIVERCLESVAGLIDAWVICDTGSHDRTPELIRSALADVPGELHEVDWVDFGHNRTQLMEIAQGAADYLLLIDADMTVHHGAERPSLDADAYMLRELGSLDFGVFRLVRGDRRWWYEGSTHECIATDGRFSQAELADIQIRHHGDGTGRDQKLLRDVGLLKRDMARSPDNPRPVFYLAQTYRDLGWHQLAARYYRRRVEMGGWDEEVFYANLQEGILRARLEDDSAPAVLLEAWERRPGRAEPLYELARFHRQRGDLAVAHMFASRGLDVPYPEDVLFIHRWVYEWGMRLERAQAAAGLGQLDEAAADLRSLGDLNGLPDEVAEFARHSLQLLSQRQSPGRAARSGGPARLQALAPSTRVGEIRLDVTPDWPAFNPTIAADGDGFRMIVRTANYRIESGVLHPEGVLVNLNYDVRLDDQLAVRAVSPLTERPGICPRQDSAIQGYEDCRLIAVQDRWFATATVCDLNPVDRREIALLEISGPEVVRVVPLASPHPERHEKNWMPFLHDDGLHILYSCGPTVTLSCDIDNGTVTRVSERPAPRFAHGFRGGSQGVGLDDGLLFVVHEVDRDGAALQYLHRFVLLDRSLSIAACSRPFSFTSDRIEFCAGMALYHDELVLSFGVSDAAAGLATVSLHEALGLLQPVEGRVND